MKMNQQFSMQVMVLQAHVFPLLCTTPFQINLSGLYIGNTMQTYT